MIITYLANTTKQTDKQTNGSQNINPPQTGCGN